MKNKTRNIILVLLLVSLVAAGLVLMPSFGKEGAILKTLNSQNPPKSLKSSKNSGIAIARTMPECPQAGRIPLPVYNSAGDGGVSTFSNDYNGFYNAFKAELLAVGGETACPYLFEMRDADDRTVYSILCQRFGIYANDTNMVCYVSSSDPLAGALAIGQNGLMFSIDTIYDNLKVRRRHGSLGGNIEVFKVSPDFRLSP